MKSKLWANRYSYKKLSTMTTASPFYDFQIKDTTGKPIDLKQFQGKVVLAFNSASKCGFTPQLQGFQSLFNSYKDKGLVVIGFPSGDFMQEMSSNDAVAEFCQVPSHFAHSRYVAHSRYLTNPSYLYSATMELTFQWQKKSASMVPLSTQSMGFWRRNNQGSWYNICKSLTPLSRG